MSLEGDRAGKVTAGIKDIIMTAVECVLGEGGGGEEPQLASVYE